MGYSHLNNAFWRFYFSCCQSCGLEHTALAVWLSVLTTLYFAEIGWWLPTVNIDQCECTIYELWWLGYHQVVACPGKAWSLLFLYLLWLTEYSDPMS